MWFILVRRWRHWKRRRRVNNNINLGSVNSIRRYRQFETLKTEFNKKRRNTSTTIPIAIGTYRVEVIHSFSVLWVYDRLLFQHSYLTCPCSFISLTSSRACIQHVTPRILQDIHYSLIRTACLHSDVCVTPRSIEQTCVALRFSTQSVNNEMSIWFLFS